jgi:transposase
VRSIMGKRRNLVRGMMRVDIIREILRLVDSGYCQREISRSLKVARSTIQNYIRAMQLAKIGYKESKELNDQELLGRFNKKRPGRVKGGKDPDFKLLHQELKSRKGMTLELLWQEWLGESEAIYSYSTFCRRYQQWIGETKELELRNDYTAGEFALSDYAGVTVKYVDLLGEEQEAQIFVSTLGASNLIYAEASRSQDSISWINSHIRAFEYFGGVPRAVKIDNLKSGVKRPCRYEPELNRSFSEFAAHYGTSIIPARVQKPKDKAKAEQAVQMVERWILAVLRKRSFWSIEQINIAIKPLLESLNDRKMQDYDMSRRELFNKIERVELKPLTQNRFIPGIWKQAKIHPDYHVEVNRHWYSVPYFLVRKDVQVKITEKLIEVFYNNERVASHSRSHDKNRHTTIPAHMPPQHLAVKSLTAATFINWSKKIGPATEELVERILNQGAHPEIGFRSILGLQRLEKKYGSKRLETAAHRTNQARVLSQRFVRKLIEDDLSNVILPEVQDSSAYIINHENIRGSEYFQ